MKESKRVLRNEVRELGRDITWTLRPGKEFEFYCMAMGSHGGEFNLSTILQIVSFKDKKKRCKGLVICN